MLPSEQFELAIYRWVIAVGLARPVNIPDFYNMPGSKGEYALVVDRLKDLHAHGYIGLFKISGNYRVPYEKFAPMEGENAFFGGGFTVEIAPDGRKFFEALEAREQKEKQQPNDQTERMPMKQKLSQPTIGSLRKNLLAMESEGELITPYDRRRFWRDVLFDFGFSRHVIDLFGTYKFDWGAILPDLYTLKLTSQNETVLAPLSADRCEQTLHQLMTLALHRNSDSALARELAEAIERDTPNSHRTNEEVLRALERGEKFDSATMEELRDAGLITMADVTHFQSRGREYLFTGLTGKGLRMVEGNNTSSTALGRGTRQELKPDLERGDSAAKQWDVFISHASEDKELFAHPLALALRNRDLRVWYDSFTLKLGDSLRRSIDRGLAESRFGVVIFSKAFFSKNWPQAELDGLMSREMAGTHVKVILPVWHGVTRDDVLRYSPTLADRMAVSTDQGLEHVVTAILEVVEPDPGSTPVYGETNDLHVGTRVHVLVPQPRVPRDQWEFHPEIWVIRKIDEAKKTALATPVLPPINGPTPTVEGQMAGPESPFKKANIPS